MRLLLPAAAGSLSVHQGSWSVGERTQLQHLHTEQTDIADSILVMMQLAVTLLLGLLCQLGVTAVPHL